MPFVKVPARPFLLTRRTALLGSLLAPFSARAFGDSSRFVPAVVQHAGRWDVRNSGLRRLAWEVQRRTSVETALDVRGFALTNPKIFEFPFLYLTCEGELPPFTDAEVESLRRYLTFGGFLFAEPSDAIDGSASDVSMRRELARVLPQNGLKALPSTHVVFKSFYLIEGAPGRMLTRATVDAVMLNKRAAVLYSNNDIMGALAKDDAGVWEYECSPGGESQRERAIRSALNIVLYALCLDYKDDAVHLPFIMNRRR